jgi:heat shock protein HslJ
MKTVSLLLLCFIILTSSCEKCTCEPCNKPEVDRELFNGTWKFISYKSHDSGEEVFYPDSAVKDITMEITSSDKVLFDGYCNHGFGYITVINDTLVLFSQISLTQLGCTNPLMVWEEYIYDLSSQGNYIVNDQNLDFFTSYGMEHHFTRIQ